MKLQGADLERIEPKLTVAGRPACFGQTRSVMHTFSEFRKLFPWPIKWPGCEINYSSSFDTEMKNTSSSSGHNTSYCFGPLLIKV